MIKSVEDLNELLESKRAKINKLMSIKHIYEGIQSKEEALETANVIITLEKEYITLLQKYITDNIKKD